MGRAAVPTKHGAAAPHCHVEAASYWGRARCPWTASYLDDHNDELYFQSLDNDKYLERARAFYRECWIVRDKVCLSFHPLRIAL